MFKPLKIFLAILFCSACNNPSQKPEEVKVDSSTIAIPVPTRDSLKATDTINFSFDQPEMQSVPVMLQKGDSFSINILRGYRLSIAAEVGRRLRFLAKSPDGRLFATDMYDRSDNKNGRVLIFENWNDSNKKFETVTTYLAGLHNPNQVAFHGNYIYIAETGRLRRFVYNAGDKRTKDTGHTIATFPDYGLSYKYGGWHLTRSLAFQNDKLYVSVGSSCNACLEKEEMRAAVLEMNPDGTGSHIFARGLRNSVGLKWIGDQLWGTGMGRDLIGPDKPEDVFQEIERDGFYGWPFYFQYKQKIYADDQFKDSTRPAWVKEPPKAKLGFKAHSAPLGFEYFKNFEDPILKNAVLVCLHGSTSVWRQRGNSIVRLENNDRYTEIVSGFLTGKTEADRHGRPCDILMNDNRSFFFTDDLNGVLYYLWKP
jgi:glucose/arabinose dehydrogenase